MLDTRMISAIELTQEAVERFESFSAYDITLKIREMFPDLYVAHDDKIRGPVHGYMARLMETGDYEREVMVRPEDGAEYYLYRPHLDETTLRFVKDWVMKRRTFTPQSISRAMEKEGLTPQAIVPAIEVAIQVAGVEYEVVDREHDGDIYRLYRPDTVIQNVSDSSSWLEGWQYVERTLTIYKKDGKVFVYSEVDTTTLVGLTQADSVGRFFNHVIRDNFEYTPTIP